MLFCCLWPSRAVDDKITPESSTGGVPKDAPRLHSTPAADAAAAAAVAIVTLTECS